MDFSYNFNHSSYLENYVNIVDFVCTCFTIRYFKHDLSLCIFAINF